MSKYLLILSCLAALCSAISARADLVAFPSGDASWTVDIDTKSSNAGPNRQIKEVQVTQMGNVKRARLTWSDGVVTEKWAIPGLPVVFEEDPRNGSVRPTVNGTLESTTYEFYLTYDSFAFTWVTPDTLKEKAPVTYSGKQCFHYATTAVAPLTKNAALKREAWIDSETLLPVAYDNGTSLSTYKFQPKPPTDPLVMPPVFQKAVKYYKTSMGFP